MTLSRSITLSILLGFVAIEAASALPICPPPPARRHDCIVDGDTWWIGRTKYRHATIDTPEIEPDQAKCRREIAIGLLARDRLVELTARGFKTEPTGKTGRYHRQLAFIRLPDGREAGAVLVSEGLASVYGQKPEKDWCR